MLMWLDVYGASMVKCLLHAYGQMSMALTITHNSVYSLTEEKKKRETKHVRPLYSHVFTVLRRSILVSVQL